MRLLAQIADSRGADRPGALRMVMSLPNALANRLRRHRAPDVHSAVHAMTTEELSQRLTLTVIGGHPDRQDLAHHLKPSILDWQTQNWDNLGQRIARLDSLHAALPSGERVATALGQALFRHIIGPKVCQMIERGQSVTTSELPEQLFAPLARALAKSDTQPALHFLAAQFNLETGWARRGNDFTEFALEDAIFSAQARFRVARTILDHIASRAPHSAYFSELDYRVRAAEGTTEDELNRAALRWTRTDPKSLTPYAVHGQHLLPRWYGEETSLDTYACKVWSKTNETLGAAAYSACYLSAMEADPAVLLDYDPKTFRIGLIDMMQQSEDPDVTCNAILRALYEVSTEGFGIDGRETIALRRARKELRDTFCYLARNTLGPVMPDAWGRGWSETRILRALAEAFEDDIASGRHIAIGLDGAVVGEAA
ncbi:hypothetical protein [Pseudooceanicola sp.]|uniref:hypothetical protein n=1 Tax=Pseudooceanicola sp. TaxID=1914328 RepID=UPI0035C7805C